MYTCISDTRESISTDTSCPNEDETMCDIPEIDEPKVITVIVLLLEISSAFTMAKNDKKFKISFRS